MTKTTTPKRSSGAVGFTLVEMLLVTALIVFLIALLLPALSRSREMSRREVCASNLGQLFNSLTSYVIDNRGRFPGGNATIQPGHGLGSTYDVVKSQPYGLAFLVVANYSPPNLLYCPSWKHPFNQLGVVDTPGNDPWFAPGEMGGWPVGEAAGPTKHRGISYHYRSSFDSASNRPPSNKYQHANTPIIADHFVRREVLYGRDYGHGDGYNVMALSGGVSWYVDTGGEYMNMMQPQAGGITNGKWAYQEVIWKQF